jgi:hypothetical protein
MSRVGRKAVAIDEEFGPDTAKYYNFNNINYGNGKGNGGNGLNNNVTVWKTITFVLAFVLFLFATNIIDTKGSGDNTPHAESIKFKEPHSALVLLPVTPVVDSANNNAEKEEKVNDNKRMRTTTRHTYKRRGQPMNAEDQKDMKKKWSSWTLVDDKERPTEDYYTAYPNRDIPRTEFPSNAWQIDNDYLAKFLPEAIKLVERTQEAILAEYGKTEGSWNVQKCLKLKCLKVLRKLVVM